MKRKSIISILTGTVLLCSMPSCMDLDETVYDKVQADKFGKTEAEINSIIAPIYKTLKKAWPNAYFYMTECSGDMAITPTRLGGDWWDNGAYKDLHMHTWTPNTGTIKDGWNDAMQSISTCNQVYSIIEASPSMTDEARTRTLAEIRGIRAYWYYMLIDNFGNVPLVTDFSDTELPATKSRKEVYDFVVKELNEIKDKLRDDVTGASYGKFTKGAAYTLLAKMYLNAEVWTGTPNYQGVIDACNEVMKLDYIIEPDWKQSFIVNNQNSKEIILPICFGRADGGNTLHYRTLHYLDPIALGMTVGTWNGICAQPDYVKAFDDADKRKVGSFLMGEMKDPATGKVLVTAHNRPLIHTIDLTMIPGTERGGTTWGDVNQEDGARANKWEFEVGLAASDQENDFAIFRLADVYLMKAEALVRAGQDNAEATRLVNIIRTRGFGNTNHNYTSVTLDNIRMERKFELAWEMYSRQDNIRFGTFLDARFLKTKSDEYRKLFCIPQDAWQTNNKLVQNPGYPAFAK